LVTALELTRMHGSRASRLIAFVLAAFAAAPALTGGAAAAAAPALVVDVDSGKVLYAERATDPWFPASITKLMTTYVALSAVQEGKVRLDTLLAVSENAASQPPSKMAFRPGTQVTLDNALKIIMVKSANDVATVIAEGIGGSVEGFAKMMNDAAWRIGMRESHWTNPHGLPDPEQYTSARDMAILGRALLRDFPEQRGLFQLSAIQLGKRVMANHNGLIGRYPGADGMKTGFICSSGFNVVASATRDGRRLITIVMGSPSAAERTHKAADLFDRGFATSTFFSFGGKTLEDLPPSTTSGPPDMRPVICGGRRGTPSEDDTSPAEASATGNAENGGLFAAPGFASFASAGGSIGGPRKLGPRAPLQPVLVWTGPTPGSNVADNEEPQPRRGRKGRKMIAAKPVVKPLARAGRTGEPSPAAQAFTAAKPDPVMDDGKGGAKPASPAATLAKTPPLVKRAAKAVAKKTAAVAAKVTGKSARTAGPAKKPVVAAKAKPAAKPKTE
jgi:D-alanyl-D-alanine carboxypeptidase